MYILPAEIPEDSVVKVLSLFIHSMTVALINVQSASGYFPVKFLRGFTAKHLVASCSDYQGRAAYITEFIDHVM